MFGIEKKRFEADEVSAEINSLQNRLSALSDQADATITAGDFGELQRIEAEKVSISEKLGVLDTVLVKVRERDLQERQEAEAKERAKQIASAQKVAKKLVASAAKVDFALKTLNAAFSELEGCTTNYQQALQRAGLQDHARLRNGLAYACKRGFYSSAPGLAKLVGAEYVRSARRENLENALSSLIIDEVK